MSKKIAGREQFFAAEDLISEDVEVPEMGGTFRVKQLSQGAIAEVVENQEHATAAYVAASVVDEKGERIFTVEDIPAIEAKSPAALRRIVEVVLRINGRSASATENSEKKSEASSRLDLN